MPGMKTLTGMSGTGGAMELAEMLRQMGRGRDTVLAHITPEEAQMLLDMGGSGTTNPNTGLPEFQEEGDFLYGDEFDPYAGQAVTSTSGGITPEAEAYYTQNAARQAPGQTDFGPADQYFGQQFTPQGEMDIGFGPGRFGPEYTPQDVSGMAPDQFQRMQAGVEPSFLQSTAQKIQTGLGQEQALEIVSQRGAQVVQAGREALAGGEQLASKAGSQLQAQGQNVMTAGKEAFGQTEQVVSKAATELQAQGSQLASKAQSTIEASRGAVSDLVENVGAKSSDLLASVAEKGALETLGEITGISAIPVVGEVAALGGLIYGAISGIEDLFSHTSSKPAQPLPQAPVTAGIVHQAGL